MLIKLSIYILFSYRNKLAIPPIKLGSDIVTQTDSTKFLGLYIDQNLRFNHHIDHISRKLSKSIGILRRLEECLSFDDMLNLFHTFIHPYILYVIVCWYAAPRYLTDKIVKIQKKSIRHIYDLPYNAHTNDLFIASNILTVDAVYNVNVLLYMFKTINTNYDPVLLSMLRTNSEQHSFNTRFCNNFLVPRYSKCVSQKDFYIKVFNCGMSYLTKLEKLNHFSPLKKPFVNCILKIEL